MTAEILIITLVSEQTIPNVQFLKWFFRNNLQKADLLFVSTKKMEEKKKSENILSAVDYLERWFVNKIPLEVDENELDEIRSKVEKELSGKKYKRIVSNITGGTKMMSIALYDVSVKLSNCEIYYQTFGKDLLKIFPEKDKYEMTDLLTLEECMRAHGIKYKNGGNKINPNIMDVYENVIKGKRDLVKKLVSMQNATWWKNIFKNKKEVNVRTMEEYKLQTEKGDKIGREEFCSLIEALGFNPEKFTHSDLKFITGGWFEEYTYQKIKEDKKIKDENIALGVEIEKDGVKNELDVVFLDAKNKLNVIECKSFVDGDNGNIVLNDALYKLRAIMKSKFGLNVQSYLYTKSEVEKDSVLGRAKEFEIEIVTV